ncbi:mitochondrial carrier family [Micromonas commoda]|uniref:Mitochondrial carrier family n=1 Tax=Micromonas commoda (strain RCC299 / NOUM17 / CCMP2709) TaxID=296587 RepID=C1E911_MICCC|nr:mitochondrial carrier family [Micromonas commoda]ACO64247.1 mitochondrial carrier family [Micromonas commoda]|eukprot:XP_002502989.1 mitochondrial carrier family [Micromonas commoda]
MEPRELAGHMASGVVAGTAVEAALYPIDTIKTRLQAARGGAAVSWRHLYKGLGGNLVGVVPACALFFAVYEPAKRALLPIPGDGDGEGTAAHHRRTAVAHLAAAASAGLASSLVRVPTEVVKTRMQTGQFSSARAALRHIVTKEGRLATGLFAGFGSFLLRDLPFDAIEFASYEQLKLARRRPLKQHESAVLGAIAGAVTGAVTTPLDVVKTRLMTQGAEGRGTGRGDGRRYRGVADCVARMVREEGAFSLLKGIQPRVTFIGIGGGVFFFALEAAKGVFVAES